MWDNAQKRLKWLVVTALTCFISSFTVSQFEGALQSKVALAILMSIVATMGGTVGMQVSTVAIRAIAMHDLRPGFIQPRVIKEVNIAALTGFISAALLGVVAFGWFGEMLLSIIFASSILFNMVWSGLVGVLIPVTLDRMGFDPALSAGTFVIMLADVLGYVAFLGLASYLVV